MVCTALLGSGTNFLNSIQQLLFEAQNAVLQVPRRLETIPISILRMFFLATPFCHFAQWVFRNGQVIPVIIGLRWGLQWIGGEAVAPIVAFPRARRAQDFRVAILVGSRSRGKPQRGHI